MHVQSLSASIPPVPRRPLDILNFFVFLLLLAIATITAAMGRLSNWPIVIIRPMALLVALLVIIQLHRRFPRSYPVDVVANFYPIPVILVVFDSLQPLITAISFPNRDAELIQIDR